MYMFLDPNLRPLTPDLNNPESRQIFEEHKQLAEEYLKVTINIECKQSRGFTVTIYCCIIGTERYRTAI